MTLLDWSDRSHWDAARTRPCRHCGWPTHLRTTAGAPAHKVCEEQAQDGEGNQLPSQKPTTTRRRAHR